MNNRGRLRASMLAGAAFALIAAVPAIGRAATWSLLGGAGHPAPLVTPLGEGKLLVCALTRCDRWDLQTGIWSPAPAPAHNILSPAQARLRDGSLLVLNGSVEPRITLVWSDGVWRKAAELPEWLGEPQIQVMADGRVIVAGRAGLSRQRAYVADPDVTAWSLLAEAPAASQGALLVTRTGLYLTTPGSSGLRLSRKDDSPSGWTEIPLPNWSGGVHHSALAWQDEVLMIAVRAGRRETLLVTAEGKTRATAKLPDGDGLTIQPVAVPPGRDRASLFLRVGAKSYLWRTPDQPPLEIPLDPIGDAPLRAAIDDSHFIASGPRRTLELLTLDDLPPAANRRPAARPCDGLERYLDVAFERDAVLPEPYVTEDTVRRELALVTPACREQVQGGEVPELRARVHTWSNAPNPSWQSLGRIFTCAFREGAPPAELSAWMAAREHPLARAVCMTQLPGWPGGEAALAVALESSVRMSPAGWQVDDALRAAVKASDTPTLRDRLGPVLLRAADEPDVNGFETLREVACPRGAAASSTEPRSAALQRVCAAPSVDRSAQTSARGGRTLGAAAAFTATAILVGATTMAYVWREEVAGRAIATGSGVMGGLTIGIGLTGLAVFTKSSVSKSDAAGGALVGGALAGGILGGIAAYALTSSPASRAPATAAGLALPYILILAFTFN